jgi:AcrR family transcriptional regulator
MHEMTSSERKTVDDQGQRPAPGGLDSETGLDDEAIRRIQRLWAAPTPARRGPKPTLSVERIVEAAFELAEGEGLDAVSMARVGQALGVSPMALYRHVSGKDELLMLLADRLAAELPDLSAADGWRGGLEAWIRAQIEFAVARPWFLDLPLSAALPGPHRLRWIDQAFRIMADLPLAAEETFAIVGMLAQLVLGEARVQVEGRRAAAEVVRRAAGLPPSTPEAELDPAALAAANPYASFEVMLQRYADPAAYPHLMAALAAPDQPRDGDAPRDELEFDLSVVLDGIEAYVARKGRRR